jgi:hypothetical protein
MEKFLTKLVVLWLSLTDVAFLTALGWIVTVVTMDANLLLAIVVLIVTSPIFFVGGAFLVALIMVLFK